MVRVESGTAFKDLNILIISETTSQISVQWFLLH